MSNILTRALYEKIVMGGLRLLNNQHNELVANSSRTWYVQHVSSPRASHETRSSRPITDVVVTENLIGSLT